MSPIILTKGIAFFGLGQGVEEVLEIGVVKEDAGAVITPVEGVVNQTVGDKSRYVSRLTANAREARGKMN
jgi:hypothetical protein